MRTSDREVLFRNEAFAIGVPQVVSGAAAAGALSQFAVLTDLVGRIPILIFITLMVAALVFSVMAAFYRHQYKMWDVKTYVADSMDERKERSSSARRDLRRMRRFMATSVILLCAGFVGLVLSLWWYLAVAEWLQGLGQNSP